MGSTENNDRASGSGTQDLIAAACRGEDQAQSKLLERYEPLLRSQVLGHMGSERFRKDGEDVLQIIRLAVFRALPSLRTRKGGPFVAWLKRLVKCRLLDWERARRNARRTPGRPSVPLNATDAPEVAARTPTPSRVVMTQEEIARLHKAIDSVPDRYRSVLRLIFEQDPTPTEVAAFLGKTPEAARKFVARALGHLRHTLKSKKISRITTTFRVLS